MNNKYFYMAVTIAENGRFYAYVVKLSTGDNVLSKLKIKGILHATLCQTRKRAKEIVERWNAVYKANGEYLFNN